METAENKAKSILPWWRKIVEGTTQATENRGGNRLSRCSHLRSRISRFAYYSLPPNYETILRGGGSRSRGRVSRQLKRFLLFHYSSAVTAGTVFTIYGIHFRIIIIAPLVAAARSNDSLFAFLLFHGPVPVSGGEGGGEIERPTE